MLDSSKTKPILKLPYQIYRTKICRLMCTANNIDLENTLRNEPQYPPIKRISVTARSRLNNRKKNWYSKIESLPTVEQKLIELNMPKYYGYYSAIFSDEALKPICTDFLKFATRTQVYKNIPMHYYEAENKTVDKAVSLIKEPVEELISLHFGHPICRKYLNRNSKIEEEKYKQQNFLFDLNNVIMKYLRDEIPHLPRTSVDLRPRIEAFWFVGGFRPPSILQKKSRERSYFKPLANYPYDRAFRSSSRPAVALRTNLGLSDVIPFDENFEAIQDIPQTEIQAVPQTEIQPVTQLLEIENKIIELPNDYSAKSFKPLPCSPFNTDPKNWALPCRKKKGVIVPGFWPGLKDEHGHIFLHSREIYNRRLKKYGESFASIMLEQHALNNAFTQAMSYALYQGFTPGCEMTYPIVQQMVSSDGQMFQFGLYQMNTMRLYSHHSTKNKRINYLWLSDNMPLFESVEGDNVKGLNEEVLRRLCLMYLKNGEPRENPCPYLADYKYLMHHDAPDEYKEEFQKMLHKVLSEKPIPVNFPIPEIYPWEHIYKVKFQTRPQEKKYRFFENRWVRNPFTRRLDDYNLEYIPKVRRLYIKIKYKPRIHSELLFKHDERTIKKVPQLYDDHEIAFKTMNIDKDTPPYFNGLMWRRGMNKYQPIKKK